MTIEVHRLLRAWEPLYATWQKASRYVNWSTQGAAGDGVDREATACSQTTVDQDSGLGRVRYYRICPVLGRPPG